MLVIFDTNIFIYGAQDRLDLDTIIDIEIGYASVTKVEALGFWNIGMSELTRLARWFDEGVVFELGETVVNRAIELRQMKKMGLGDAIIAATALVQDAVLWTANEADFADIEGLRLHNPLRVQ